MSLERVSRDQIPPGAKILTRREVMDEYWKIILEWKPTTDTIPIRYGIPALGITSLFTNTALLLHYRRRLKLGRKALLMSMMGCCTVPTFASAFGHAILVTNELFFEKTCPICIQFRAIGLQLASSFAYGLTVTPLLCFLKAQNFCSYNVPGLSTAEGRKKTWQLYIKFTKLVSRKIYIYAVFNSFIATGITVSEIKCVELINDKLFRKNQQVEELKKTLE